MTGACSYLEDLWRHFELRAREILVKIGMRFPGRM